MVDWSNSSRTSWRSQLRQLDLGSHWDWDYMVTFCDGEHILFGRLSICPQKKIPILNWCSGTIGWETSQTIGTDRIAWLSSNGGSVTSSHHDLCHDRHPYIQWSHPYCPHLSVIVNVDIIIIESMKSWLCFSFKFVLPGPGWVRHLPLERLGL